MANITRIKAGNGPRKAEPADDETIVRKRVSVEDKKTQKAARAKRREAEKKISTDDGTKKNENAKLNKKVVQNAKSAKKPFVLFRPFVALGHYLRDAWQELRQVRWPNRKTTWKMLIAVIIYAALFMVLITVLDLLFSGLFNLMFSK